MSGSRLTPLQARLLEILADVRPAGVLTGGAALVGFYTYHRTTRDLDLRWPAQDDLVDVSRAVGERLRSMDVDFEVLQSSPTFERLRVVDGDETVIVDLVADPVASIEEPTTMAVGAARVLVDTPHEILVNKLCALLGRMELRDLHDLRELLAGGGDLDRALQEAPRKDGGFSPLMLAWVLQGMPAHRLAAAAGWSPEDATATEAFKRGFIDRLLSVAAPGE